jgi:hypothetical protein
MTQTMTHPFSKPRPQMAALDCFLELEPMDMGVSPATEVAAAQAGQLGRAAASADAACWVAVKRQQQLKLFQQQQQHEEGAYPSDEDEDDVSRCTSSPGCSYSATAAMGASLLDLADDACSAPSVPAAAPAAAAAGSQLSLLPDGTSLAAATFFDDLAAKGSVYQYCLQRQ